jgi:hypothetical protein
MAGEVRQVPKLDETAVAESSLLANDVTLIGLEPGERKRARPLPKAPGVDSTVGWAEFAHRPRCPFPLLSLHPPPLRPPAVLEWQSAEVNTWLQHLGPPYSHYADRFEAEQIRGRVIPLLDEGMLLRLGVASGDVPAMLEALRRYGMRLLRPAEHAGVCCSRGRPQLRASQGCAC